MNGHKMRMPARAAATLAISLALGQMLLAGSGQAATVMAVTEEQLVQAADAIFFGTVIQTEYVVKSDKRVDTRGVIQVYQGLYGVPTGELLLVDMAGGEFPDGRRLVVSGTPKMQPGDMVVGFVTKRKDAFMPIAMSYGWLRVKEFSPGDLRVYRDLEGLHLVAPGGGAVDPGVAQLGGVALKPFLARMEYLIANVKGAGSAPDWQGPTAPKGVSP